MREPFALVGAIGTAPVVGDGEGEGGPEEEGERGAEFELGLAFCFFYISLALFFFIDSLEETYLVKARLAQYCFR